MKSYNSGMMNEPRWPFCSRQPQRLPHAANPAMGEASDASVTINAVFMDAAAVQQATGSDFKNSYTVVEVTVTPKGDKPLTLQPDDFLLRISSDSDSSGPMVASQVYGAGSAIVLHGSQDVIGITRNAQPGYSGIQPSEGLVASVSERSDRTHSRPKCSRPKQLPIR